MAIGRQAYLAKLERLFRSYNKIVIVGVDNVGSTQIHECRKALRGEAEMILGKNSLVKRTINLLGEEFPALLALLPIVRFNVGFVFTNGDIIKVAETLMANKREAPAKPGQLSPIDVTIPAGPTAMLPADTGFLQALNISTKIAKGKIEITSDVHLLTAGQTVGSSECALLAKMDIKPFFYGLEVLNVYDNGSLFDSGFLSVTDETLAGLVQEGIAGVASLALGCNFPALPAAPHMVAGGIKDMLAVGIELDLDMPELAALKAFLADPSAFAVAAPAAAAEAVVEEESEEEESEEDSDLMGGLF
ncbi:60S acidic ribosomal protein P0 [Kipferlia bialata]|uniref:60S acidic ribosomal protein P0 n=1 Tax=Kipferlia bialata TaxID=797122 RepID=A0A9K3GLD3_9EUKA|nr:60S acidic ribosomal protein P0 [Kipferlia bialata]|eukprot:g8505.t1